jgi:hypothetical protein
MTKRDLVREFAECLAGQTAARSRKDYKTRNRLARRCLLALYQLVSDGGASLLLEHEDEEVRTAASKLLTAP